MMTSNKNFNKIICISTLLMTVNTLLMTFPCYHNYDNPAKFYPHMTTNENILISYILHRKTIVKFYTKAIRDTWDCALIANSMLTKTKIYTDILELMTDLASPIFILGPVLSKGEKYESIIISIEKNKDYLALFTANCCANFICSISMIRMKIFKKCKLFQEIKSLNEDIYLPIRILVKPAIKHFITCLSPTIITDPKEKERSSNLSRKKEHNKTMHSSTGNRDSCNITIPILQINTGNGKFKNNDNALRHSIDENKSMIIVISESNFDNNDLDEINRRKINFPEFNFEDKTLPGAKWARSSIMIHESIPYKRESSKENDINSCIVISIQRPKNKKYTLRSRNILKRPCLF